MKLTVGTTKIMYFQTTKHAPALFLRNCIKKKKKERPVKPSLKLGTHNLKPFLMFLYFGKSTQVYAWHDVQFTDLFMLAGMTI